MRNGNNRMNWILLALCLISLAGHLLILERLPEQIPVHWNAAGGDRRIRAKSMDLIMGVIPLGIWVLMAALPRLDPRRKNYEKHQKAYGILTLLLTLAMIAFSWMTALAGLGYNVDVGMLIPMVLGGGVRGYGKLYAEDPLQLFCWACGRPGPLKIPGYGGKTQWMGGISFIVMGVGDLRIGIFSRQVSGRRCAAGGASGRRGLGLPVFLADVPKAKKEGKLGRYEEESED